MSNKEDERNWKVIYAAAEKEYILEGKKISDAARDVLDNFDIPYNLKDFNRIKKHLQRKITKKDEKHVDSKPKTTNEETNVGKSTLDINNDGSQSSTKTIKATEKDMKDVNFLLKMHGYDPLIWELQNAKNSQWETQLKGGIVDTLYASKITVKPIKNAMDENDITELLKLLKNKGPVSPKRNIKSKKMLEVNICDLHFGKMAWSEEVGSDYDYKIATKRFNDVIEDVIEKTKHVKFEKILFVFGNDFYNFATVEGTTINGTRQDNDSRWKKLSIKGNELLIRAIDRLSQISNVEVLLVEGNHDSVPAFQSLLVLDAYYRNAKNVEVNMNIKTRKYIEYGNCLIGFTHGDKEKKKISTLMQSEAAAAWGRTIYREVHCGHFHSEQVKEENGIITRYLSSITGSDAWHYESGWVGALAKAQSFIWDKEYGLENIIMSNVMK